MPAAGLQVFMVGGAVRDRLLGRDTHDRDWVVVGSTPTEMLGRGFVPVGRDFPVFLHPRTHEEYALARTERKSGRGHQGFVVHAAPSVTLEEDLARRDLRINAMAAPADWQGEAARVIDPWGGLQDLRARRLRHVGPAFCEDPLRILRLARFAATFGDFSVAQDTLQLMCRMVADGELQTLAPERVWQELSRALRLGRLPGEAPSRMLAVLHACGALASLLPELNYLWISFREKIIILLDNIVSNEEIEISERYSCLIQNLDATQAVTLAERLRLPRDCRELASLLARECSAVHACQRMDAAAIVDLLRRCDALRQPQRFSALLRACACLAGLDGPGAPQGAVRAADSTAWPQARYLQAALRAARQQVDSAAIAARAAASGLRGEAVGAHIHAARVQAVAQWQRRADRVQST